MDAHMAEFRRMGVGEQLAAHLRRELETGVRSGLMPGVLWLEKELGVNRNTLEEALRQLEAEGFLESQGPGRRRKIIGRKKAAPMLRVGILYGAAAGRSADYMVEIHHRLSETGHAVVPAPKSMTELGMDLQRIRRMIRETEADAWVVQAGPIELLEWFGKRKTPVFALFGRRRELRIAGVGPDKIPSYAEATRRLVELGHRRIVLLARARRRLPEPGLPERAFLNELAACGLPVGGYNLPDWEETPDGFHARLEELFRVTPPTALIIDGVSFFIAALQFLSKRKLRVPEDISLVCTDDSPYFGWCRPPVSHIRWDKRPVIRRVLKWVANVSQGREDLLQTETSAEFVPGGTIGPVTSRKRAARLR